MGSLGLASCDSYADFNSDPIVDSEVKDCLGKNRISKKKKQVILELGRSKSLSDEDLEELKGCLDLGFGFSYEEIPELCNTLPALELCYSLTHNFPVISNWNISSPGDHPEDVKARLRFWAQAVACTVKLCN